MEAATYADLIARTRDLMSEESADFFTDSPEIASRLNEGAEELFGHGGVFCTSGLTTTSGATEYAFPSGFRRLEAVKRGATAASFTNLLTPMRPFEVARTGGLTASPPQHYTVVNSAASGVPMLRLLGTPVAETLSLDYWSGPVTITSGCTLNWPRPFHFAPCYFAAADLLEKAHEPEKAMRMLARFENLKRGFARWQKAQVPYRTRATRSQFADSQLGFSPHLPHASGELEIPDP